jgi:hypothetical protein
LLTDTEEKHMNIQHPEIQGISVVWLGDFNPKIFQPAWFAAEGLVRKQEAEKAKIEIIHPEVVTFTLEWLILQVTRERFFVSTSQEPYYEVVRDLVLGTFSLLRHTPVHKMGINRDMHFRMDSEEAWHAFGHRLAPKDLWKDILGENPGMRSLTMEGRRQDGCKGYTRVKVEPSEKVHPGVYVNVNDHYEVADPKSVIGSDEIRTLFERSWSESLRRSAHIAYALLEKQ